MSSTASDPAGNQEKPRIALTKPCCYDPEYNKSNVTHYRAAIEKSGGEAVMIDPSMPMDQIVRQMESCSAVLLSSSRADVNPKKYNAARHSTAADPDPLREAIDELLLRDAYNMRKPVLGICYGLQSLSVWRGGTLDQHVGAVHQQDHAVTVEPDSILYDAVGKLVISVNSKHRQAVNAVNEGSDLRITARATEDGVIEAVEGTKGGRHFVLGLQWHPERDFHENEDSRNIFNHFIQAARNFDNLVGR